jgi:hypothetical protein
LITWLSRPEDDVSRELHQRLIDDFIRDKRKGVCVALTFPPLNARESAAHGHLLKTILLTGAPIMVWSRKHERFACSFDDIKHEMESVVCVENLPKLPLAVFALRTSLDASIQPEHVGNHIVLFWDDPNRVPAPMNRDMTELLGD